MKGVVIACALLLALTTTMAMSTAVRPIDRFQDAAPRPIAEVGDDIHTSLACMFVRTLQDTLRRNEQRYDQDLHGRLFTEGVDAMYGNFSSAHRIFGFTDMSTVLLGSGDVSLRQIVAERVRAGGRDSLVRDVVDNVSGGDAAIRSKRAGVCSGVDLDQMTGTAFATTVFPAVPATVGLDLPTVHQDAIRVASKARRTAGQPS